MPEFLPAERWVNAHIEIVVPLDVDPDADPYAKQEAAAELLEALNIAGIHRHAVSRAWWEDGEVAEEEIPSIPEPPRRIVDPDRPEAPR
jgi:hypothetical protein